MNAKKSSKKKASKITLSRLKAGRPSFDLLHSSDSIKSSVVTNVFVSMGQNWIVTHTNMHWDHLALAFPQNGPLCLLGYSSGGSAQAHNYLLYWCLYSTCMQVYPQTCVKVMVVSAFKYWSWFSSSLQLGLCQTRNCQPQSRNTKKDIGPGYLYFRAVTFKLQWFKKRIRFKTMRKVRTIGKRYGMAIEYLGGLKSCNWLIFDIFSEKQTV